MSITAKWVPLKLRGRLQSGLKNMTQLYAVKKKAHFIHYRQIKSKEVRDISKKTVLKESMRDYINIK